MVKIKMLLVLVDSSIRIEGNPLEVETLVIKIYITTNASCCRW